MATNPHELHALAFDLKNSSEEVRLRANASRAFYAGYHWCEAIRLKMSMPLTPDVGSHFALIRALRNFTDPDADTQADVRTLGKILNRARRLRVAADYLLNDSFSYAKADEAYLLAGQVKSIASTLL